MKAQLILISIMASISFAASAKQKYSCKGELEGKQATLEATIADVDSSEESTPEMIKKQANSSGVLVLTSKFVDKDGKETSYSDTVEMKFNPKAQATFSSSVILSADKSEGHDTDYYTAELAAKTDDSSNPYGMALIVNSGFIDCLGDFQNATVLSCTISQVP